MASKSVTPQSAVPVGAVPVGPRRPPGTRVVDPALPTLPANVTDLRGVRNQRLVARLQATGLHREAARTAWSANVRRQVTREIAAAAMDVAEAYRRRLMALLPGGDDSPATPADHRAFVEARAAIDDACSRLAGLPMRCQARLLRELPVPRPTLVVARLSRPIVS